MDFCLQGLFTARHSWLTHRDVYRVPQHLPSHIYMTNNRVHIIITLGALMPHHAEKLDLKDSLAILKPMFAETKSMSYLLRYEQNDPVDSLCFWTLWSWYICFLDGSFSLRVLFGNNTHRIPKLRGKGQTQTVMFRLSNQSRIISWPLPLSSTSLLSFLPVGNNYLLNGHCLFFINNSVCFSMKFVIHVILHIFYHPFILRHLTSVRDPYFTCWLQIGCHIASKFSWGEQPLCSH